jgi:hypothetical protein
MPQEMNTKQSITVEVDAALLKRNRSGDAAYPDRMDREPRVSGRGKGDDREPRTPVERWKPFTPR